MNELQYLFHTFHRRLSAEYRDFNLPCLRFGSEFWIERPFSYTESMRSLMKAFERDFMNVFHDFPVGEIDSFWWYYEHKPNNIMIESFGVTGGVANSRVFGLALRQSMFQSIWHGFTGSNRQNIRVEMPFCGQGAELPGLLRILSIKCQTKSFSIRISDVDEKAIQVAHKVFAANKEAVSDNIDCDIAIHDLASLPLPSADLVIGLHPPVFDLYETQISQRWSKMLNNLIECSDEILLFFLNPHEQQETAHYLAKTHNIAMQTMQIHLPMPKEFVRNAANLRHARAKKYINRHYGYVIHASAK